MIYREEKDSQLQARSSFLSHHFWEFEGEYSEGQLETAYHCRQSPGAHSNTPSQSTQSSSHHPSKVADLVCIPLPG